MLFFVTANPGVIELVQSIDTAGAVLTILRMYAAYWGANYLL